MTPQTGLKCLSNLYQERRSEQKWNKLSNWLNYMRSYMVFLPLLNNPNYRNPVAKPSPFLNVPVLGVLMYWGFRHIVTSQLTRWVWKETDLRHNLFLYLEKQCNKPYNRNPVAKPLNLSLLVPVLEVHVQWLQAKCDVTIKTLMPSLSEEEEWMPTNPIIGTLSHNFIFFNEPVFRVFPLMFCGFQTHCDVRILFPNEFRTSSSVCSHKCIHVMRPSCLTYPYPVSFPWM